LGTGDEESQWCNRLPKRHRWPVVALGELEKGGRNTTRESIERTEEENQRRREKATGRGLGL
jgi:hypothetical protein